MTSEWRGGQKDKKRPVRHNLRRELAGRGTATAKALGQGKVCFLDAEISAVFGG